MNDYLEMLKADESEIFNESENLNWLDDLYIQWQKEHGK